MSSGRPAQPPALIALGGPTLPAQAPAPALAPPPAPSTVRADADYARAAYDSYRSMLQSSPYRSLRWQYLGPTNISGRATDVAVADRGAARRIYAAYATSGVWKTDDDGATWQAIFEHQPSTSIGDIAVAPSNPDIVWVGTGEANLFRASMPGVGVFKSTDGGGTFQHSGLSDTHTIARILVHPTNPDIVYVAASGHGWTDNETRGVFKTIDGGRSWTKVLYRSPRTGAIDLVMDASDPATLYAAMWQRVRRKWSDPRVEPGYSESGDLSRRPTAAELVGRQPGPPPAQFRGRIGLDGSKSNPNVLYAFVDNHEEGRPPRENERDAYGRLIVESRIKAAEIYRTDDKADVAQGQRRRRLHDHTALRHLRVGVRPDPVDPSDENTIYTLGLGLNVSHDAGRSFTVLRGMHGDHHGLWIDPANPSVLYNANDGGFYASSDAGRSWSSRSRQVDRSSTTSPSTRARPAWAYGSIQDIGSRRGRVDLSAGRDRIPAVEWIDAPGGEGSHHALDPQNPNLVYSHGFYGSFTREDLAVSGARRPGRADRQRRGPRPASRQSSRAGPRRAGVARAVDGAHHRLAPRSCDDLRRVPAGDAIDEPRRQLAARSAGT